MKQFYKSLLLVVFLSLDNHLLDARPLSIAGEAKATASSQLHHKAGAARINDGLMAIDHQGNWIAKTSDAWIRLDWNESQDISKVVIYNHPEEAYRVLTGKLTFSDGSSMDVTLPEDGTAHAVEFESRKTDFIRFTVTSCKGKAAGLSEIEVYPAYSQYDTPVDWADPYIETDRGRFFLFITGQRPYGMIGAAPMTLNWNNSGGGYAYRMKEILGFPQIHNWTISGINLMPTTGKTDPSKGIDAWKSAFKHDDEIVQPGYHRVYLKDSHVWVHQTATDRVSFYKFQWTEDMEAQILFSLNGLLGNSRMTNAEVKKISDTQFEGSFSSVDRAYNVGPHDFKIYFVAEVDKEWDSFNAWDGEKKFKDIDRLRGNEMGTSLAYNVKAGDELKLKIAISYTSVENAHNNLETECSTWDWEAVCNETRDIWNDWMSRITVEGGEEEQRVKLYTDLWHVLMGRHKINDANGDYPDNTTGKRTIVWNQNGEVVSPVTYIRNTGVDENGKPLHNMYNSDAFWLTQWNLNVLWSLAWPEMLDDMAASLVTYSNNGGLIPRGPSGGGYSFIMTGCPGTNLIVSAYMKDLMTKADPQNAYEQIKKNHMPGGMMGLPDDIRFYIEKGWWPASAGINIEAAFQDWGAAQMAKKLGHQEDYQYFMKRSESWKKCFNPKHGLLFPVMHDGSFMHDDPLTMAGYVEANAWQATWGVSHDIPGLSDMMGGDDVFCEKLNYAFEKEREHDYVHGYGAGYVSYANQPGCSNAHVFSYAHKPWMSQYWVRRVREQAYSGITSELG